MSVPVVPVSLSAADRLMMEAGVKTDTCPQKERERATLEWPNVAIVILNWKNWRDSITCLDSLLRLTYPHYRVVVLDNGSHDCSVERIEAWARLRLTTGWNSAVKALKQPAVAHLKVICEHPRFALVASDENLGFSAGNNSAMEYILSDAEPPEFVFLVNSDTRMEPDCLMESVKVARRTNAAIVGATIKDDQGRVLNVSASFSRELLLLRCGRVSLVRTADEFQPISRPEGAAMLLAREFLQFRRRTQGFFLDPAMFMYCEEMDLAECAKRSGFRVVLATQAIVYHRVSSSSHERETAFAYYYDTRNRVQIARRYLPRPVRFVFHTCYLLLRLRRVVGESLLRRKWGVASAITYGLYDGYRGVTGKWSKHPE